MQATLLKCVPAVAVLAMVFGCAVNNGSAAGPTNDPAVRKAIESADSGFAVAFKNADAAAAAGYYSDDAASRPPNAEPLIGKAGIAKGYGDLFKSLGTVVDVSATAKDVDIYADHAVEVGSMKKRRPVWGRRFFAAAWFRASVRSSQLLVALLGVFFDHFLRDFMRRFIIALEMTLEERSPMRHRLNRRRVSVQLGLRNDCANHGRTIGGLGAENMSAP